MQARSPANVAFGRSSTVKKRSEIDLLSPETRKLRDTKVGGELGFEGEALERQGFDTSVPYWQQGDESLETKSARELRAAVRLDPEVRVEIRRFWALFHKDSKMRIRKSEYQSFLLRLCKLCLPDFDRDAALQVVEADWERDSHGKRALNFSLFFDSVFELVDTWCPTIDGKAYAQLLRTLRARLTQAVIRHADGRVERRAAELVHMTSREAEQYASQMKAATSGAGTSDAASRRSHAVVRSRRRSIVTGAPGKVYTSTRRSGTASRPRRSSTSSQSKSTRRPSVPTRGVLLVTAPAADDDETAKSSHSPAPTEDVDWEEAIGTTVSGVGMANDHRKATTPKPDEKEDPHKPRNLLPPPPSSSLPVVPDSKGRKSPRATAPSSAAPASPVVMTSLPQALSRGDSMAVQADSAVRDSSAENLGVGLANRGDDDYTLDLGLAAVASGIDFGVSSKTSTSDHLQRQALRAQQSSEALDSALQDAHAVETDDEGGDNDYASTVGPRSVAPTDVDSRASVPTHSPRPDTAGIDLVGYGDLSSLDEGSVLREEWLPLEEIEFDMHFGSSEDDTTPANNNASVPDDAANLVDDADLDLNNDNEFEDLENQNDDDDDDASKFDETVAVIHRKSSGLKPKQDPTPSLEKPRLNLHIETNTSFISSPPEQPSNTNTNSTTSAGSRARHRFTAAGLASLSAVRALASTRSTAQETTTTTTTSTAPPTKHPSPKEPSPTQAPTPHPAKPLRRKRSILESPSVRAALMFNFSPNRDLFRFEAVEEEKEVEKDEERKDFEEEGDEEGKDAETETSKKPEEATKKPEEATKKPEEASKKPESAPRQEESELVAFDRSDPLRLRRGVQPIAIASESEGAMSAATEEQLRGPRDAEEEEEAEEGEDEFEESKKREVEEGEGKEEVDGGVPPLTGFNAGPVLDPEGEAAECAVDVGAVVPHFGGEWDDGDPWEAGGAAEDELRLEASVGGAMDATQLALRTVRAGVGNLDAVPGLAGAPIGMCAGPPTDAVVESEGAENEVPEEILRLVRVRVEDPWKDDSDAQGVGEENAGTPWCGVENVPPVRPIVAAGPVETVPRGIAAPLVPAYEQLSVPRLVVTSPPGCGASTVAAAVAHALNVPLLSPELVVLRAVQVDVSQVRPDATELPLPTTAVGRAARKALLSGRSVGMDIVVALLRNAVIEAVESGRGYVLDLPRTIISSSSEDTPLSAAEAAAACIGPALRRNVAEYLARRWTWQSRNGAEQARRRRQGRSMHLVQLSSGRVVDKRWSKTLLDELADAPLPEESDASPAPEDDTDVSPTFPQNNSSLPAWDLLGDVDVQEGPTVRVVSNWWQAMPRAHLEISMRDEAAQRRRDAVLVDCEGRGTEDVWVSRPLAQLGSRIVASRLRAAKIEAAKAKANAAEAAPDKDADAEADADEEEEEEGGETADLPVPPLRMRRAKRMQKWTTEALRFCGRQSNGTFPRSREEWDAHFASEKSARHVPGAPAGDGEEEEEEVEPLTFAAALEGLQTAWKFGGEEEEEDGESKLDAFGRVVVGEDVEEEEEGEYFGGLAYRWGAERKRYRGPPPPGQQQQSASRRRVARAQPVTLDDNTTNLQVDDLVRMAMPQTVPTELPRLLVRVPRKPDSASDGLVKVLEGLVADEEAARASAPFASRRVPVDGTQPLGILVEDALLALGEALPPFGRFGAPLPTARALTLPEELLAEAEEEEEGDDDQQQQQQQQQKQQPAEKYKVTGPEVEAMSRLELQKMRKVANVAAAEKWLLGLEEGSVVPPRSDVLEARRRKWRAAVVAFVTRSRSGGAAAGEEDDEVVEARRKALEKVLSASKVPSGRWFCSESDLSTGLWRGATESTEEEEEEEEEGEEDEEAQEAEKAARRGVGGEFGASVARRIAQASEVQKAVWSRRAAHTTFPLCPVTLAETGRAVRGDVRCAAEYAGRVVLCASPAARSRFLEAPHVFVACARQRTPRIAVLERWGTRGAHVLETAGLRVVDAIQAVRDAIENGSTAAVTAAKAGRAVTGDALALAVRRALEEDVGTGSMEDGGETWESVLNGLFFVDSSDQMSVDSKQSKKSKKSKKPKKESKKEREARLEAEARKRTRRVAALREIVLAAEQWLQADGGDETERTSGSWALSNAPITVAAWRALFRAGVVPDTVVVVDSGRSLLPGAADGTIQGLSAWESARWDGGPQSMEAATAWDAERRALAGEEAEEEEGGEEDEEEGFRGVGAPEGWENAGAGWEAAVASAEADEAAAGETGEEQDEEEGGAGRDKIGATVRSQLAVLREALKSEEEKMASAGTAEEDGDGDGDEGGGGEETLRAAIATVMRVLVGDWSESKEQLVGMERGEEDAEEEESRKGRELVADLARAEAPKVLDKYGEVNVWGRTASRRAWVRNLPAVVRFLRSRGVRVEIVPAPEDAPPDLVSSAIVTAADPVGSPRAWTASQVAAVAGDALGDAEEGGDDAAAREAFLAVFPAGETGPFCPWALATEGVLVPGEARFATVVDGSVYFASSPLARAWLQLAPGKLLHQPSKLRSLYLSAAARLRYSSLSSPQNTPYSYSLSSQHPPLASPPLRLLDSTPASLVPAGSTAPSRLNRLPRLAPGTRPPLATLDLPRRAPAARIAVLFPQTLLQSSNPNAPAPSTLLRSLAGRTDLVLVSVAEALRSHKTWGEKVRAVEAQSVAAAELVQQRTKELEEAKEALAKKSEDEEDDSGQLEERVEAAETALEEAKAAVEKDAARKRQPASGIPLGAWRSALREVYLANSDALGRGVVLYDWPGDGLGVDWGARLAMLRRLRVPPSLVVPVSSRYVSSKEKLSSFQQAQQDADEQEDEEEEAATAAHDAALEAVKGAVDAAKTAGMMCTATVDVSGAVGGAVDRLEAVVRPWVGDRWGETDAVHESLCPSGCGVRALRSKVSALETAAIVSRKQVLGALERGLLRLSRFGGRCPVTGKEGGGGEYFLVWRGKVYLCSSREAAASFAAHPAKYACLSQPPPPLGTCPQPRVSVLGPPCSGRSWTARAAAAALGAVCVRPADAVRFVLSASCGDAELRTEVAAALGAADGFDGQLQGSLLVRCVAAMVASRDVRRRGYVLDGLPTTAKQALLLADDLAARGAADVGTDDHARVLTSADSRPPLPVLVLADTDESVVVNRASGRLRRERARVGLGLGPELTRAPKRPKPLKSGGEDDDDEEEDSIPQKIQEADSEWLAERRKAAKRLGTIPQLLALSPAETTLVASEPVEEDEEEEEDEENAYVSVSMLSPEKLRRMQWPVRGGWTLEARASMGDELGGAPWSTASDWQLRSTRGIRASLEAVDGKTGPRDPTGGRLGGGIVPVAPHFLLSAVTAILEENGTSLTTLAAWWEAISGAVRVVMGGGLDESVVRELEDAYHATRTAASALSRGRGAPLGPALFFLPTLDVGPLVNLSFGPLDPLALSRDGAIQVAGPSSLLPETLPTPSESEGSQPSHPKSPSFSKEAAAAMRSSAVLYGDRVYFVSKAASRTVFASSPSATLAGLRPPASLATRLGPRDVPSSVFSLIRADPRRARDAGIACGGLCVVTLRDGSVSAARGSAFDPDAIAGAAPPRPLIQGRPALAATYRGRLFLFSSERALSRFLRHPSRYAAAALPPKGPLPPPTRSLTAEELGPGGRGSLSAYLDHSTGRLLEAALAFVADPTNAPLRHPSLDVRSTALALVALWLKAHNPHTRPAARRARQRRRLQSFIEECTLAQSQQENDEWTKKWDEAIQHTKETLWQTFILPEN